RLMKSRSLAGSFPLKVIFRTKVFEELANRDGPRRRRVMHWAASNGGIMSMTALTPLEHRGWRLASTIRGGGPPVVLIQGVAVQGDGWLPQTEALAARYQCLTFDNRGMGRSQPVGAPVTVEQMAEDALVIMDAQGWRSAHVVSHSLGGLIA